MGPPSYMRSVVDGNVVMRRIHVYLSGDATHLTLFQKFRCNKVMKWSDATLCTVSTSCLTQRIRS